MTASNAASNQTERRYTGSKLELRSRGNKRTLVGYAAVFNRKSDDLGGFREVLAPGAFDNVLGDDCRCLFNHDSNQILGRQSAGTLRLSVDGKGLRYECDLGNQTYARDLAESLERGDVRESSFAFSLDPDDQDADDWTEDRSTGAVIRTVKRVARLWDVSAVTTPAYPDATSGIRALIDFRSCPVEFKRKLELYVPTQQDLLRSWFQLKQRIAASEDQHHTL